MWHTNFDSYMKHIHPFYWLLLKIILPCKRRHQKQICFGNQPGYICHFSLWIFKGEATSCKNAGSMMIVTLILHISKLELLNVPEILSLKEWRQDLISRRPCAHLYKENLLYLPGCCISQREVPFVRVNHF